MYIQQDYALYTPENHLVWSNLYQRRMPVLQETACSAFLDGLDLIGLDSHHVPNLADVNARLQPLTGWQAMPVAGYIPARQFFQSISVRKFPTTVSVRSKEQIDYLPEPDIFHDVFGHVPLHSHPVFADFLARYGELAYKTHDEKDLTGLTRLFWFTVEFGLIRENEKTKLFGSGLMSSHAEGPHALSDAVEKRDFNLEKIINTHFEIDHFQPLLDVIDSFEQLYEALDHWTPK